MMTLAAAYYNLGASCEHLGKLDLALLAFHRGLRFCLTYIPETSRDLSNSLQTCINQLTNKYTIFTSNSLKRQLRREDLAPNSLDPKKIESIKEQREYKQKRLMSEWRMRPVKGLSLPRGTYRSPRTSIHEISINQGSNLKQQTVDNQYQSQLKTRDFNQLFSSLDKFRPVPLSNQSSHYEDRDKLFSQRDN